MKISLLKGIVVGFLLSAWLPTVCWGATSISVLKRVSRRLALRGLLGLGLLCPAIVLAASPQLQRQTPSTYDVSLQTGQSQDFSSYATDADGDLGCDEWYEGSSQVKGRGCTWWGDNRSTLTSTLSRSWSTPGTYYLKVYVYDKADPAHSSTPAYIEWKVTVTAPPQHPPQLTRQTPSTYDVLLQIGQSQSFSSYATDADGDLGCDEWYEGTTVIEVNECTWFSQSDLTSTLSRSWATPGTYYLKVYVYDKATNPSTPAYIEWKVTVTVPPQHPPQIERDNPLASEISILVNQSQNFIARATDADGDMKCDEWYLDGVRWTEPDECAGGVGESTTYPDATKSWSTPGTHVVKVQAKDNAGNYSGFVQWNVTVTAPSQHSPQLARHNPSASEVSILTGQSKDFIACATDADGDMKCDEWYLDGVRWTEPDECAGAGESTTYPDATKSWSTPGTHVVKVQAKDNAGNYSDFVQWTVYVHNPEDSVKIDTVTVNQNTVTISWSGSDSWRGYESYLWLTGDYYDYDGNPSSPKTYSNLFKGAYTFTVWDDGDGTSATTNFSITTTTPPSIHVIEPRRSSYTGVPIPLEMTANNMPANFSCMKVCLIKGNNPSIGQSNQDDDTDSLRLKTSWRPTSADNGVNTLRIWAYDTSGNSIVSTDVVVAVDILASGPNATISVSISHELADVYTLSPIRISATAYNMSPEFDCLEGIAIRRTGGKTYPLGKASRKGDSIHLRTDWHVNSTYNGSYDIYIRAYDRSRNVLCQASNVFEINCLEIKLPEVSLPRMNNQIMDISKQIETISRVPFSEVPDTAVVINGTVVITKKGMIKLAEVSAELASLIEDGSEHVKVVFVAGAVIAGVVAPLALPTIVAVFRVVDDVGGIAEYVAISAEAAKGLIQRIVPDDFQVEKQYGIHHFTPLSGGGGGANMQVIQASPNYDVMKITDQCNWLFQKTTLNNQGYYHRAPVVDFQTEGITTQDTGSDEYTMGFRSPVQLSSVEGKLLRWSLSSNISWDVISGFNVYAKNFWNTDSEYQKINATLILTNQFQDTVTQGAQQYFVSIVDQDGHERALSNEMQGDTQVVIPSWWTEFGVLDPADPVDDYAAANVGQLKSLAQKACQAMNAHLSGGAGAAITNMVNGFTTDDDYAVANVGQAKAVAKPFYDRLGLVYPWDASEDHYAAVNVGQLKQLFSFDLFTATLTATATEQWQENVKVTDGSLSGASSRTWLPISSTREYTMTVFLRWYASAGSSGTLTIYEQGSYNWNTHDYDYTPIASVTCSTRDSSTSRTVSLQWTKTYYWALTTTSSSIFDVTAELSHTDTQSRSATVSGSQTISGAVLLPAGEFNQSYSITLQPQHGGSLSGMDATVTDDNPQVETSITKQVSGNTVSGIVHAESVNP